MFLFYFSLGLAVLATGLYHIFQKSTPGDVHPFVSLTVTYIVAALASVLLIPTLPLNGGLLHSLRQLNWVSYGLGLVLVGLEIGFLLAYRAGWNISLAAVIANVAVTVLLVPVGLFLFREKVSAVNLIGVGVCVVGLIMVNYK